MRLTALWLMQFLKLNLNTIITNLNLPSRLEACLFFFSGGKKISVTMATVSTATRFLLCWRIVVDDNNTFTVRTVFLIPVVILSCFLYHTWKITIAYTNSKYETNCNKRYQFILVNEYPINFEVQWMLNKTVKYCKPTSICIWEIFVRKSLGCNGCSDNSSAKKV